MPNLEYLAEILTRSINEMARAKDAILAEKAREDAPREVRFTREEWAREMQLEATRPSNEAVDVRERTDEDLRVARPADVIATQTKPQPGTPKKNN